MTIPGTGHGDARPTDVKIDVLERGASGATSDRRLFMQLLVYSGCGDTKPLVAALESRGVDAVLYADVSDPMGVGLLTFSEDPSFFVTSLRDLLTAEPFSNLRSRPDMAMFGRTYSSGFEPDLDDWLLERPRRTVLNPACSWAIWYPLRRVGAFARLEAKEQGAILREHATIGRAYGDADLAHDIRLACHGLDTHDNDFVIGLVGRELHPLSHLVQAMRKTAQTAEYIQGLGPFFIGHTIWRRARR
jgi:chlorite dismutase